MLTDLLEAVPFVAPIGAGVALLWLLGRDRDDTDYTVDDYQPELAPARRDWPLVDRQPGGPRRLRSNAVVYLDNRGATFTPHILPMAPVPGDARAPLYAETLFRTWHPESPGDAAARMLREIAAVEQAKTGDLIWQRATDRDMTGSFPVVAVAV